MPSNFDDWEPLDSYTPGGMAEPLAVARRMHEDGLVLDFLVGRDFRRWPELSIVERNLAVHFARVVLRVLGRTNLNVIRAAERLHEERLLLSDPGEIDDWIDLSPEAQDVAIELIQLVADWLTMEGTSPWD